MIRLLRVGAKLFDDATVVDEYVGVYDHVKVEYFCWECILPACCRRDLLLRSARTIVAYLHFHVVRGMVQLLHRAIIRWRGGRGSHGSARQQ